MVWNVPPPTAVENIICEVRQADATAQAPQSIEAHHEGEWVLKVDGRVVSDARFSSGRFGVAASYNRARDGETFSFTYRFDDSACPTAGTATAALATSGTAGHSGGASFACQCTLTAATD